MTDRMRILILDDNPRRPAVLERMGCDVVRVRTATECIAMLTEFHGFHRLMLDHDLGEFDEDGKERTFYDEELDDTFPLFEEKGTDGMTGMDVVSWLERNEIKFSHGIVCHSLNRDGNAFIMCDRLLAAGYVAERIPFTQYREQLAKMMAGETPETSGDGR